MKKKLLFWIDSSLYNFINAKFIVERFDCDLYSIYDITDKPKIFFKKQKLVPFKNFWFFHDQIDKDHKKPDMKYLESFESKFNINLWLQAFYERNFYDFNKFYNFSSDEVLSILEQECKFYEKILDEIKPDYLIIPQPYFHHDNLLIKMCKKLGIICLLSRPTRLDPNRFMIDNNDAYTPINFEHSTKNKEFSFDSIQNKLKSIKNFETTMKSESNNSSNKFSAVINYIFNSNSNLQTHYTYYGRTKFNVLFTTLIMSIKGKIRKNFLNKHSRYSINSEKNFIYFPLHQDEEESTLVGAPFFTDQIQLIKNIIKSLPIGYKLFVKESPNNAVRDWRKISDYQKLLDLPNLVLLHPTVDPNEILKKCSLVISIVGTTALESAYYMKPSIIFGDTPFSNLNSVTKINQLSELPSLIRTMLTKKIDYSDVADFHDYVEKNSFQLNLSQIWKSISDHFQFGGAYVDVEITEQQVNDYIANYTNEYTTLANAYIQKIKSEEDSHA
tara:strand:- start:32 stop:1531 length:1500 start_codon:yes stop_codon:yes gene_type:complete